MMTALAVAQNTSTEMVDVETLGKYAKEQWDLGDQAANEAGEPYWYRGAEAMEKAKRTVLALGKETYGEYQERVTGRDKRTCQERCQAYREHVKLSEDTTNPRNERGAPRVSSIRGLIGRSTAGQSHMKREWMPDVDAQAKQAFREQVTKTIETRAEEATAEKALAKRLIDIGYKVLAKELHPDKGGNRDAMTRLSEVRRRLYRAFNI